MARSSRTTRKFDQTLKDAGLRVGPWLSRSPDEGRSWWVHKDAFPQTTPSGQPAVPLGDLQIANNADGA